MSNLARCVQVSFDQLQCFSTCHYSPLKFECCFFSRGPLDPQASGESKLREGAAAAANKLREREQLIRQAILINRGAAVSLPSSLAQMPLQGGGVAREGGDGSQRSVGSVVMARAVQSGGQEALQATTLVAAQRPSRVHTHTPGSSSGHEEGTGNLQSMVLPPMPMSIAVTDKDDKNSNNEGLDEGDEAAAEPKSKASKKKKKKKTKKKAASSGGGAGASGGSDPFSTFPPPPPVLSASQDLMLESNWGLARQIFARGVDEFTFLWNIDDFGAMLNKAKRNDRFYIRHRFRWARHNWRATCYPTGNKGGGDVGVYIKVLDMPSNAMGMFTKFQFTALHPSDPSKSISSGVGTHVFTRLENDQGFSSVIPAERVAEIMGPAPSLGLLVVLQLSRKVVLHINQHS